MRQTLGTILRRAFRPGRPLSLAPLFLLGAAAAAASPADDAGHANQSSVSSNAAARPAGHNPALLVRADADWAAGRAAAARAGYRAWLAAGFHPQAERALARLALLEFRLGDLDAYEAATRRLEAWFPGTPLAGPLAALRWEAAWRRGDWKTAGAELERLVGAGGPPPLLARRRYSLAVSGQRGHPPARAIELYLAIVRSDVSDMHVAHSLLRLAEWSYVKEDRELALWYLNRLLRRYPSFPGREAALGLKRNVRWRYLTKKHGLGDDSVAAIAFDGDDVWVGTYLGGVTRFTRSSGRHTLYNPKNSALVSGLVRGLAVEKSRVWAATFEGLSWYEKALDQWRTVFSVAGLAYARVKSIVIDEGKLWVATIGNGVSMLDMATGTWKTWGPKEGLPDANAVVICPTPGSVWVGTVFGGVARYDKRTGAWSTIGRAQGLPDTNVKAILFDGTRLWFGLHGQGVASCDEKGGDWKHYTKANSGLPSNFVYALAYAPGGKVWMGTLEGGVAIHDPAHDTWERLSITDGLPSNDIIVIEFEGRYIWFGTLEGGLAVLLTDGGDE